jgi:hypothetical protein
MNPDQRPTLPVFEIAAQSFSMMMSRTGPLAQVAFVPATITLISQIASGYFAVILGVIWLNSAWYVPYMIIVTPFAVAWTRIVLLGSAAEPGSFVPRFGSRELTYLGVSLLLALVTVGVPLGTTLILFSSDRFGAAFGPMLVLEGVILVLAIFTGLRLSFALPAIAVDRFGGFGEAWRQTEGAALRIFAIGLLVSLPIIIAQSLSLRIASLLGAELPALIVRAAIEVTFTFAVLAGALMATALAYQRLTNHAAAPAS